MEPHASAAVECLLDFLEQADSSDVVSFGGEGVSELSLLREGAHPLKTDPKKRKRGDSGPEADSFSELRDVLQDPKKWLRLAVASGDMGIRLIFVGQKQVLEQTIGEALSEEQVALLCRSSGTFFTQGIAKGGLTWLGQTLKHPIPLALHLLDLDLKELMVLEPLWDYARRECLKGLRSLRLPAELTQYLEDLPFQELVRSAKEMRDLRPVKTVPQLSSMCGAMATVSLLLVKDSPTVSAYFSLVCLEHLKECLVDSRIYVQIPRFPSAQL